MTSDSKDKDSDTLTNVWLVWNTSDAVFGRVFNGTNKPKPTRRR